MNIGQLETTPFCPVCNKQLDGFSANHEHAPGPGDLTVCAGCATILEFSEGMILLIAPQDIIDNMDPDIAFELGKSVGFVRKLMDIRNGK